MITKYYNRLDKSEIQNIVSWYPEAYRIATSLAKVSGYSVEQCAGVLAAISINTGWEDNVKRATNAILGRAYGHFKFVKQKVQDILDCKGELDCILDILNGDKVKNFCLNILGDHSLVTVDRWMSRMWGEDLVPTGPKYRRRAAKIKELATKAGYPPSTYQALLWVAIRKYYTWNGTELVPKNIAK